MGTLKLVAVFGVIQIILSISFVSSVPVLTTCRDGWVAFNGSCYLFADEHTMRYTEAEHFCRQYESHLVHVNSQEENAFLKDFMAKLKATSYWMGLTDVLIDGIWKWQDTDTKTTFTDWNPGQPNGGALVDCVVFYQTVLHKWYNLPCENKYALVCEMMGAHYPDENIIG